jgi:integrase
VAKQQDPQQDPQQLAAPLAPNIAMAIDDGIIERDPTAKLRNLKRQKRPVDPFTREEAESILAASYRWHYGADAIYAAYFEFAFFSGTRPSETPALRWPDIDERKDCTRIQSRVEESIE